MEENQGGANELTLWVIYASYGAASDVEKSFIYAQDASEAEKIVDRWKELHPEYKIHRYIPYPMGFPDGGTHIPGKIQREKGLYGDNSHN